MILRTHYIYNNITYNVSAYDTSKYQLFVSDHRFDPDKTAEGIYSEQISYEVFKAIESAFKAGQENERDRIKLMLNRC